MSFFADGAVVLIACGRSVNRRFAVDGDVFASIMKSAGLTLKRVPLPARWREENNKKIGGRRGDVRVREREGWRECGRTERDARAMEYARGERKGVSKYRE